MLKSPYLFAVSVLVALVQWTSAARAQDLNMGLSFDLPPVQEQVKTSNTTLDKQPISSARVEVAKASDFDEPEVETQPSLPLVDATESIALTFAADTVSIESLTREAATGTDPFNSPADTSLDNIVEDLSSNSVNSANSASSTSGLDDWIFENGTHSLVARTVGNAEGTRRADGRRTNAYYGHTDPGNGVWNLGTFSYQHDAKSPEDADEKQLRRLKRQGLELETQAAQQGLALTLEEKLNGLDLANQAPLAALDRGGYIERLAQAKRLQMSGDEAILWARTHAYIDPDTRRWNAPGLGNNIHSISTDQERRMSAISSAIKTYSPSGFEIASLERLEQVSLADTGSGSSPTLIASTIEDDTVRFGSIEVDEQIFAELSSDFAVSFGLPPVEADHTTREPIVVADSAEIASADSTLEVDEMEAVDIAETETILSDIGIAFSPTGNIADLETVASQTDKSPELAENELAEQENIESTEAEAQTDRSADLFTLNPSNGLGANDLEAHHVEDSHKVEISNGVVQSEQLGSEVNGHGINSLTNDGGDSVIAPQPDTAINSNNNSQQPVNQLHNGQSNNDRVSSETEILPASQETASRTEANLNDVAEDSTEQLQSLLAGVSTPADSEILEDIKDSDRSDETESARKFFRTEDKIVPEK
ncbi:MAG: hypothetical protein AAF528_05275 [Cyanobacteria bacterium P01_C01_bin.121]